MTSIGNVLWCSYPVNADVDRNADLFYRAHVKPRRDEMRRGHRLDLFRGGAPRMTAKRAGTLRVITPIEPSLHARSFASIYVLVLWLPPRADEPLVRVKVDEALPVIERLTVALPPPDPAPGEAAGKLRA